MKNETKGNGYFRSDTGKTGGLDHFEFGFSLRPIKILFFKTGLRPDWYWNLYSEFYYRYRFVFGQY